MTRNIIFFFLTILSFSSFSQQLLYDESNLLTPVERESVSSKLKETGLKHGIDIRCYIAKSLGGKTTNEFTLEKANELRIGAIGLNNGIIILMAPKEEQFLISNSFGVQWILNDQKTEAIIDGLLGTFKDKKYQAGLLKCLTLIDKELGENSFKVTEAFLNKTDFSKLQGKVIAFDYTGKNPNVGFRVPLPSDAQFDPQFKIDLRGDSRKIATLFYSKYMEEMIRTIISSKKILIFSRVRKTTPLEFELLGIMKF